MHVKFAKKSFFIVFLVVALSIMVTGCLQIVSAQTEGETLLSSLLNSSIMKSDSSSNVSEHPTTVIQPSVNSSLNPTETPVSESVNSSINQVNTEVTTVPTAKPSLNPTTKPVVTTSVKPTAIPAAKPTTKPTAKPIVKQTTITTIKPTAIPTRKPAATPTPKPVTVTSVKPVSTSEISLTNLIGQTLSQVVSEYGQPNAKELSEYGFTWYVYKSEYKRFIMIGISGDRVVGAYSNSTYLNYNGIKIGTGRTTVRSSFLSKFGSPVTRIQKGNIYYNISNLDQKDIFYTGSSYATCFYDNIDGNALTSIQIIEKATELKIGYYGTPSAALAASYERISFYLANAIRSRKGIALFLWDDKMATIARSHSSDMVKNNYFSHTSLSGVTMVDRMKAAGVLYANCAENISKNHASAIYSHEAFMNSAGHRKNILRDSKYLGVGVTMGNGCILLTQNFVTYR
jgi:uncharacterized protein YkwD